MSRRNLMFCLIGLTLSSLLLTAQRREEASPYTVENLRHRDWQSEARPVEPERRSRQTEAYRSYVVRFTVPSRVSGKELSEFALLSLPSAGIGEKIPLILLLHGYIPPAQYSTERSYPVVFARYAASEFAVLKPDYRGHGESEGREEPQRASQMRTLLYTEDVLSLLAALRKHGFQDHSFGPIFVMGHSMGGEVALRMLQIRDWFRAASLWGPMSASAEEHAVFYGTRRNRTRAVILEELRGGIRYLGLAEAPVYNQAGQLSQIAVPLRIHHPDTDKAVPISWTQALLPQLKAAGVTAEYFNYPGDDHNISAHQREVQRNDLNWFRDFLANDFE